MANAHYDAWKLDQYSPATGSGPNHGAIDFKDDDIRAVLVDTADYTVNTATHADHADIAGAAIVATSGNLAGGAVTISSGTLKIDFDDFTWSTVTGDQAEAVVFYKWSGSSATSLLFLYLDTFSSGMPVTPNGGDIDFTVHADGLFTY